MHRHRREASGGCLQFGLTGMRVARRRDESSDRTVGYELMRPVHRREQLAVPLRMAQIDP